MGFRACFCLSAPYLALLLLWDRVSNSYIYVKPHQGNMAKTKKTSAETDVAAQEDVAVQEDERIVIGNGDFTGVFRPYRERGSVKHCAKMDAPFIISGDEKHYSAGDYLICEHEAGRYRAMTSQEFAARFVPSTGGAAVKRKV